LPRGMTSWENSPASMCAGLGGKSTMTQWKKSTRGSEAGTVRPSWLTSSPRLGTSGSQQISTSDFVPAGSSDQARWGLWLPPRQTWLWACGMQKALSPWMMRVKLSVQNFIFTSRGFMPVLSS
jgi:hypothetical protein